MRSVAILVLLLCLPLSTASAQPNPMGLRALEAGSGFAPSDGTIGELRLNEVLEIEARGEWCPRVPVTVVWELRNAPSWVWLNRTQQTLFFANSSHPTTALYQTRLLFQPPSGEAAGLQPVNVRSTAKGPGFASGSPCVRDSEDVMREVRLVIPYHADLRAWQAGPRIIQVENHGNAETLVEAAWAGGGRTAVTLEAATAATNGTATLDIPAGVTLVNLRAVAADSSLGPDFDEDWVTFSVVRPSESPSAGFLWAFIAVLLAWAKRRA